MIIIIIIISEEDSICIFFYVGLFPLPNQKQLSSRVSNAIRSWLERIEQRFHLLCIAIVFFPPRGEFKAPVQFPF